MIAPTTYYKELVAHLRLHSPEAGVYHIAANAIEDLAEALEEERANHACCGSTSR